MLEFTCKTCYNIATASWKLFEENDTTYQERLGNYLQKILQLIKRVLDFLKKMLQRSNCLGNYLKKRLQRDNLGAFWKRR